MSFSPGRSGVRSGRRGRPRAPRAPVARALAPLALAPLALATLAFGAGCSHPIPRSRVSDFFAKDFELPRYRPAPDFLARERQRILPSPAAAALGGAVGAYAGGYRNAWRASAAGGLGDLGGASTARALAHASEDPPLPKDYSGLELALPIIAVDPNAGLTIGVLPVSVFQEKERITNIFAPQITYNEIDGTGALFRMRRSFTIESSAYADFGSTTNGAHTYDFRYTQFGIGPKDLLFFRAKGRYVTDLTPRFYGIGNDTKKEAESSYALRRSEGAAALGVALPFYVKLELSELISATSVGSGHAKGLPSSNEVFPFVPGMQERTELLSHRVSIVLDTRDAPSAPTAGVFAEGYYEIGDATLGSDVAFQKAGFVVSGVYSYWDKRLSTAARIAGRWVAGSRTIPFYEQSQVGGKTSLRGFGEGRFIDRNALVGGIEERWNVWSFKLMGVESVIQLAAFAETGRVFRGGQNINLDTFQVAGGGSIRLLIPSSDIVTSIDLGYSREGLQTFVDLGYPF